MNLTETPLPAYVVRRLQDYGYMTVDAVAAATDSELRIYRNMGRGTITRIRAVIPHQPGYTTIETARLERLEHENAAQRALLQEMLDHLDPAVRHVDWYGINLRERIRTALAATLLAEGDPEK